LLDRTKAPETRTDGGGLQVPKVVLCGIGVPRSSGANLPNTSARFLTESCPVSVGTAFTFVHSAGWSGACWGNNQRNVFVAPSGASRRVLGPPVLFAIYIHCRLAARHLQPDLTLKTLNRLKSADR
jgi:hypothetical protein